MNINLSDEQMRGIVAAAIFEKIDDEQKRKLITDAVAHILEPPKQTSGYGRSDDIPSPLAQCMQRAVQDMAREEVAKYIEKEGTREKVRAIVCDAFDKVFADGELREKMVGTVADAFTDAIRVKERY